MAENGLKPIWGSIPVPTPDLSGDVATSRGTDPLTDTSGTSGLTGVPWDSGGEQKQGASDAGTEETSNPQSGLPLRPNRFSPSPAEPPAPPSLQDRNPGTIDQK